MTIFDILNDILFTKKGKLLQNIDDEAVFNNYMINRWISMYSPNLAIVINSTTNWLYGVFETKQDYYKFINKIIPKVSRKHIAYIKKIKLEDTEENENLKLVAKRLELSEREIKSYYEFSSRHSHCTTSTS